MNKSDIEILIKSTAVTYLDCARKAALGLYRNWLLLLGSVASYFIFVISASIFGGMGFGGQLILGLIAAILTSLYYAWIGDTVRRDKLHWRSLFQIDYGLLFITINVGFILFVPQFIVESLIRGLDVAWILFCLQLGIVVVFNSIPEVIAIHRFDGLHALEHSANFSKNNWPEWFLPLIIFVLPWVLLHGAFVLLALAVSNPLLPVTFLLGGAAEICRMLSLPPVIGVVLSLILANWFMLFRAHLFNQMETGTRRQRIYKARQSI